MTRSWNPFGAAAAIVILATPQALAEITAAEVWDEWQAMAAGMGNGATLSAGSESYAGGVLTLAPMVFDMQVPDGQVSATLDEVVMTETGDGTVEITYGGAYLVDVMSTMPDGDDGALSLSITTPGLVMDVSRTGDETVYNYAADALGIALLSMAVDGEAVPGTAQVDLQAMAGVYTLIGPDAAGFSHSYTADRVAVEANFEDPDNPANGVVIAAAYAGLEVASSGSVAGLAAMSNFAALAEGGAEIDSMTAHQGGGITIAARSEDEGAVDITMSSTSGRFGYGVDAASARASMESTGLAAALAGDAIPVPDVSAALDAAAFVVDMPVRAADDLSDVELRVTLGGLSLSPMIWAMIDPTSALPQDPATLILALTGQMRLTADLTDPAAVAGPLPPVDFEVLTLENLRLAVAGAELTGAGGLDFSQAPEGALPGMPGVSGQITLGLAGGNALVGTLVAMGLVPQEQAAMAQMMMGMLARPVGDDQLESVIELGADGSISANGTPLR